MIIANWLGLAVIGSALIKSEGKDPNQSPQQRKLYRNTNTVSNACLTEYDCDKQREKLGYSKGQYHVKDW